MQQLARQYQRAGERRLAGRHRGDVHDVAAGEEPVGFEHARHREAGRELLPGEQEHRGLAGGDEAAVARALHAAELGEAALRDVVARPQHVEQLRAHVRNEREQDHQPQARREVVLADEAGVCGAAAVECRRRNAERVLVRRVARRRNGS